MIDQTPLPPEPPEWVPTDILEFQQFSFDLGEVYARLKELSLAEEGERAVQTFNQMEQAVQGTLQTDLTTLLSSVGRRHIAIEFPPKHEPQPKDDEAKASAAVFSQRVGMVWQVKDEQVWNRVMQVIGQFAPAAGGAVETAEEQGFKGFRLHQGPLEIGLFFGRGYLVLGVGSEVTESLLSVLRTPPTGDAALRTSGLVERGRACWPPSLVCCIRSATRGWTSNRPNRALNVSLTSLLRNRSYQARLLARPLPRAMTRPRPRRWLRASKHFCPATASWKA